MADTVWGTGGCLDESLFRASYEFEFFQAVRLISLLVSEGARDEPVPEVDDAVRFSIRASLSFPPSSLIEIVAGTDGKPPLIKVALPGLIGPGAVLPLAYTEYAMRQQRSGDSSFAAFFDIFHHRLLSLVYRAWQKHHFVLDYERALRDASHPDAVTGYLLDLVGMGTGGLQDRLPFPDRALLRYAGLLAQRPRSAECLRALLHDFLGVPVTVEQFVGCWHRLEAEELCMLGHESASSCLGEGSVAGDMVWSRQATVRVTLGPVPADQFFGFLPDRQPFNETAGFIRWFLGPAIEFQIQPVMASGEKPDWCRLEQQNVAGPLLGWCTWLGEEPFADPAADAVFGEEECAYRNSETMSELSEALH